MGNSIRLEPFSSVGTAPGGALPGSVKRVLACEAKARAQIVQYVIVTKGWRELFLSNRVTVNPA
jgi:hypothetical protein